MELPLCTRSKSHGTYWFCTDFRQVNKVTKSYLYLIPQVGNCVDRMGSTKLVRKFEGYWQVPLTTRAEEISNLTTLYKVIPFRMKNAQGTFLCLINTIISGLMQCLHR